jgi:serine/threonine protein kinase/tetratricopeptide (TPR) repeat protein
MPLAAGVRFGPYEIVTTLGAGGMGEVYRAHDTRLHRDVAIKVLPDVLPVDQQSIDRFYREGRAVSALNHPHICVIHDVGEEPAPFIVFELLEGETLKDRLSRGALPPAEALEYAIQVADGLEAAHGKGIIHRDIKPANVFLISRRHAKILDFGLAKMTRELLARPSDALAETALKPDALLTTPGTALGTIAYMSPEQVRGEDLDARSDIFSFGATLYEMLAGRPAFPGQTAGVVFDRILNSRPASPASVNPAVPLPFEPIVMKALERSPRRRYQSAAALRAALQALRGLEQQPAGGMSSARAGSTSPRRPPNRSSGRLSGRARPIDSLAVLPFANQSGDADQEYLADGLTEAIISKLSRLEGLRVVPRSTVFRYKARDIDPVLAAREMKVRGLLTGRVSQRAGNLAIAVELVDVSKNAQVWGDRYHRAMTDIFAVQEQMAADICESLQLTLTGEERRRLGGRQTENPAAYEAYMKGRHFWNRRSVEGFLRAIEFFQQAIDLDPNYAAAYTGLADTFNVLGYYNDRAPADVYPKAKAAAERALQIDERVAEAHASLGYSLLFFDRAFGESERHFLRAIDLSPAYASAHQWYGWLLFVRREFDRALAAMRRAHEIDPLSLIINDHLGYALALAGRPDDALVQLQRTIELNPGFSLSHLRIGLIQASQGQIEAAIASLELGVRLSEERVGMGYLGQLFARVGRTSDAEKVLAAFDERARRQFVSSLDRALVLDGLGRIDETVAALERAEADRISDLVRCRLLPWSDALQADPRFARLLERLGV